MENITKSIENLNMPNHLKMRMTKLIKAHGFDDELELPVLDDELEQLRKRLG